jgi:hypothetical protein
LSCEVLTALLHGTPRCERCTPRWRRGAGGPFRRFDGGGWTTSWELWEALNGCDEVSQPCAAISGNG